MLKLAKNSSKTMGIKEKFRCNYLTDAPLASMAIFVPNIINNSKSKQKIIEGVSHVAINLSKAFTLYTHKTNSMRSPVWISFYAKAARISIFFSLFLQCKFMIPGKP